jgi:hypothetical protein
MKGRLAVRKMANGDVKNDLKLKSYTKLKVHCLTEAQKAASCQKC